MAILKFKIEEVEKLAELMKETNEHWPCFHQLYDKNPTFLKKGVKPRTDKELPYLNEEVDFKKVEKGFQLVKDDGIYLMHNGKNKKIPKGTSQPIVYAEGFNPKTNEYCWEDSRSAVGGDDFVEHIPFDWYEIAKKRNLSVLKIKVTEKSISIVPR